MPPCKDILQYLYGLHRHGIKPGLGRIKRLTSALGNPQDACPSIHVAGTNGKGSTSAILYSILTEGGYKTGLYTSPHLIRFNERIRTSAGLITGRDIVRTAALVKDAAQREGLDGSLTFFEFTTAMAFVYFRDKKVDFAVFETGMGGRLDATNVVTPLASIITNVGFDHMEYLGVNLEKIAGEKAGVVKKGIPVITGEDKREPLKKIASAAEKMKAPLYRLGEDFKVHAQKNAQAFDYLGIWKDIPGLKISLRGPHQYKNAACALSALEVIENSGFKVPKGVIRRGLKKASWPGRVEVAGKNPLLILDAAHNPDGAKTLKAALKGFRYRRLILVLGIMADKDIDGIISELAPISDTVVLTVPQTERAATTGLLLEKLKPYGKKALITGSVKEACGKALEAAKGVDAVCITGSIFTIGEAKKHLPRILNPRKRKSL